MGWLERSALSPTVPQTVVLLLHYSHHIWLGRKDSNLGMAESKSADLPLVDTPIKNTGAARRT